MFDSCGNQFRQITFFLQIRFLLLFLLQPFTQDARGKEQKEVPMVLLGNKGDMVHLRQVSSEEGDNIILV